MNNCIFGKRSQTLRSYQRVQCSLAVTVPDGRALTVLAKVSDENQSQGLLTRISESSAFPSIQANESLFNLLVEDSSPGHLCQKKKKSPRVCMTGQACPEMLQN